jgi:hypothetical protein
MKYVLKATLQIEIETELNDEVEPSQETMEFLVQQDLKDLGYGCDEIKTVKFGLLEVKE